MGKSLKEAQDEFYTLIDSLDERVMSSFLNWIGDSFLESGPSKSPFVEKANLTLREIAQHLRLKLPSSATLSSENVLWPSVGFDSDCNAKNTAHVDCFLFEDEDLNRLVDEGKLTRNYCVDCGSRQTKPLTFISHSLSIPQLEFIFTSVVPLTKQKEGFHVIDIGSRLGGIVSAAHLFSRGKARVTGIEMNEELCKLQESIVESYGLSSVTVINSDVRLQKEVLSTADLVIMNNVFSFFMPLDEQLSCWESVHSSLRPGTLLIHNPSIDDVTSHLTLPFTISQWLSPMKTKVAASKFAKGDEDLFEDLCTLHLYKVREPSCESENNGKKTEGDD